MLVHSSLNLLRTLDEGRCWDGFVRLVEATDRQRGFGDYFGYTFVLRGQAELMLEADVKAWDIAPFKVLLEEAGGRFTDLAGRPTIYSGTALRVERAPPRGGAGPLERPFRLTPRPSVGSTQYNRGGAMTGSST